ncbi:unnamed protein product [Discosporangium mesarthrocarpum]
MPLSPIGAFNGNSSKIRMTLLHILARLLASPPLHNDEICPASLTLSLDSCPVNRLLALCISGYIVVVGEDAASGWYDPIIKNNGVCNNSSDDPPSVCMSPAVARFEVQETATFNFTINQYDLYNAYFIVCRSDSHVSARITSTFVNLDPEGGLTQHLAIELAMLPPLFAVIAAVAACLAMAWTVEMTRLRKFVLQIHYYCLAAIWLKTIAAILVAAYIQKQSKDGHGHLPLRVIATLAQNLSQVVFLLTLLLLSLGMSIIHPILPRREAWPVALVFVMYGGLSTGHAFCENSQGWLCNSLALMEYAVRCLVMLSTVVAINFNITNIRFNIQLPWTSSSALEYLKLEQFLAYRMTYVAYLLLPTALLIVRLSVLSWHYNWVFSTLDEFLKLVIYAYIGTTFAPLDTWLLTRAFDDRLDER